MYFIIPMRVYFLGIINCFNHLLIVYFMNFMHYSNVMIQVNLSFELLNWTFGYHF